MRIRPLLRCTTATLLGFITVACAAEPTGPAAPDGPLWDLDSWGSLLTFRPWLSLYLPGEFIPGTSVPTFEEGLVAAGIPLDSNAVMTWEVTVDGTRHVFTHTRALPRDTLAPPIDAIVVPAGADVVVQGRLGLEGIGAEFDLSMHFIATAGALAEFGGTLVYDGSGVYDWLRAYDYVLPLVAPGVSRCPPGALCPRPYFSGWDYQIAAGQVGPSELPVPWFYRQDRVSVVCAHGVTIGDLRAEIADLMARGFGDFESGGTPFSDDYVCGGREEPRFPVGFSVSDSAHMIAVYQRFCELAQRGVIDSLGLASVGY